MNKVAGQSRQSTYQLSHPLVPKADIRPRIGMLDGEAVREVLLPKRARCFHVQSCRSEPPETLSGDTSGNVAAAGERPEEGKRYPYRVVLDGWVTRRYQRK